MKFSIVLATLVGATAIVSSANAADMARKVPYAAPVVETRAYDWSGFYAGAILQYGFGDDRVGMGGGVSAGTLHLKGFGGGLTAGYNYQSGSLVAGLEADVALSGMRDSIDSAVFRGTHAETKMPWLVTVRPRVGYAFDRALIFATAGLAVGGLDTDITATAPAGVLHKSTTRAGLAAGAGIEYAVTDKISLKAEYMYVNLKSDRYDFGPYSTKVVGESHNGRVGINYRF